MQDFDEKHEVLPNIRHVAMRTNEQVYGWRDALNKIPTNSVLS